MPYIGKSPTSGGFHKLDSLTASATDTYALTLNSAAYYPETANQLLVSLNGVIQAPQDSFTVSGSNLVFDSALTASDSIDFVVALGDVLGVQSVTDGTVTTNKIANQAVTAAQIGSGAVTDTKLASTLDLSAKALTMPTGAVLQVVQAVSDTQLVLTTAGTYTSVMSGSITPNFSNSKILIGFSTGGLANDTSDIGVRLLRSVGGSDTEIMKRSRHGYTNIASWSSVPFDIKYLDSPATSSAITYKIEVRIQEGELQIAAGGSGGDLNRASIIMTEIAG